MTRLIHQTYESVRAAQSHPIISSSVRSWRTYATRHRAKYIFWTAADREKFMKKAHPGVYRQWAALPLAVMKVDVWRYALLAKNGGIYADADLTVKVDAPDLFSGNSLMLTTENSEHYCNWFLSCSESNRVMEHVVSEIKRNVLNSYPLDAVSFSKNPHLVHEITGPGAFTAAINSWLARHNTRPRRPLTALGTTLPGIKVLPRSSMNGQYATHKFMGGKRGGWTELRAKLVLTGKQKMVEARTARDEEAARKKSDAAREMAIRQAAADIVKVEIAKVREEDDRRIQHERAQRERLEKDKRELEDMLKRKDASVQALEKQKADLTVELEKMRDTEHSMTSAINKATAEVRLNTKDTVNELIQPLNNVLSQTKQEAIKTSEAVSQNKKVLRTVDDKFPRKAGYDIIERLEEINNAMSDVYGRLDATQKRLASMERTRLLEAEGAVATGLIDDNEFVLVYVGPSAASKVVLAHIKECQAGEYQITPEMQVGADVGAEATFLCVVTELDIVVERSDGGEGWTSDLRFFLPRPTNGHDLLSLAPPTIECADESDVPNGTRDAGVPSEADGSGETGEVNSATPEEAEGTQDVGGADDTSGAEQIVELSEERCQVKKKKKKKKNKRKKT